MSGERQPVRDSRSLAGGGASGSAVEAKLGRRPADASEETRLAIDVRRLVELGRLDDARDLFNRLVTLGQRRASRIAYQYLRDAGEADEAVQDAFFRVFIHIRSYREAWPFEVWFTRILINGCLDRRKARARREHGFTQSTDPEIRIALVSAPPGESPEARLLARERRERLDAAVDRLNGRQRTIFTLCHYGDYTPREVSAMTGLNESTVRVHLFRAVRKLRSLLEHEAGNRCRL